jgi:hypothetical protein
MKVDRDDAGAVRWVVVVYENEGKASSGIKEVRGAISERNAVKKDGEGWI